MSKHYSCELWEWIEKRRYGKTDKLKRVDFHTEASTAYGKSKNGHSHANVKCISQIYANTHTYKKRKKHTLTGK